MFRENSLVFLYLIEVPQAMKKRHVRPKLQETNGENDGWEHQKRQNGETKPMELLNESIEIVERNQWNR